VAHRRQKERIRARKSCGDRLQVSVASMTVISTLRDAWPSAPAEPAVTGLQLTRLANDRRLYVRRLSETTCNGAQQGNGRNPTTSRTRNSNRGGGVAQYIVSVELMVLVRTAVRPSNKKAQRPADARVTRDNAVT